MKRITTLAALALLGFTAMAQGRIEDYEVDILWKEFGLDSPEGTARGGASGGRALQYTK